MQPAKSTTEEEERGFCNQNLATPARHASPGDQFCAALLFNGKEV